MHDEIKVFFLVFSALFPIVDPLSASPIFLALTRSVPPHNPARAVLAGHFEQLCLDGWLVLSRFTPACFLWSVASGGPGWRRIDRLRVRMESADGKRRREEHHTRSRGIGRHIPEGILPANVATDHRAGLDLGGH